MFLVWWIVELRSLLGSWDWKGDGTKIKTCIASPECEVRSCLLFQSTEYDRLGKHVTALSLYGLFTFHSLWKFQNSKTDCNAIDLTVDIERQTFCSTWCPVVHSLTLSALSFVSVVYILSVFCQYWRIKRVHKWGDCNSPTSFAYHLTFTPTLLHFQRLWFTCQRLWFTRD